MVSVNDLTHIVFSGITKEIARSSLSDTFLVKQNNVLNNQQLYPKKINLLFELVTLSNGRKYTYDIIEKLGGVTISTTSRIRNGVILDPSFNTIAGIAKAFSVPLEYFSKTMSHTEARSYLIDHLSGTTKETAYYPSTTYQP